MLGLTGFVWYLVTLGSAIIPTGRTTYKYVYTQIHSISLGKQKEISLPEALVKLDVVCPSFFPLHLWWLPSSTETPLAISPLHPSDQLYLSRLLSSPCPSSLFTHTLVAVNLCYIFRSEEFELGTTDVSEHVLSVFLCLLPHTIYFSIYIHVAAKSMTSFSFAAE